MAELPAISLIERTIGYASESSLKESKAIEIILFLINYSNKLAFKNGRCIGGITT